MFAVAKSLITLAFVLATVEAAPLLGFGDSSSSSSDSQVSAQTINNDFVQPADFARLAYCTPPSVLASTCGTPCDAVGNVTMFVQAGGDGGEIPQYFVAYDNSSQTVVVSHEGTDPSNFLSVLNDASFFLTDLNTTRFTAAAGKGIQVHNGFQDTFERTADGVLSGVQNALASSGATKVLVTGHSLGAALASLDAMMLAENLDPSVQLTSTVFGLPRVGNQAWADFVDATLGSSFTHITNQHDPVPIVPPQALGFQHPAGEVHIDAVNNNGDATNIISCQGQEDQTCSAGNSLLQFDVPNHLGPYFNDISFGTNQCSN